MAGAGQHHVKENPEILLSVGEVLSPVHKLQSQLHEGDTTDPLLRYA